MKCHFCQQDCRIHKDSPWYICDPCAVFFSRTKQETVFRPNTNTHLYWLFINFDENSTKVDVMQNPFAIPVEDREDMMDSHPQTILKLDSAMQGVTPQNMHDKLKTLLIFS